MIHGSFFDCKLFRQKVFPLKLDFYHKFMQSTGGVSSQPPWMNTEHPALQEHGPQSPQRGCEFLLGPAEILTKKKQRIWSHNAPCCTFTSISATCILLMFALFNHGMNLFPTKHYGKVYMCCGVQGMNMSVEASGLVGCDGNATLMSGLFIYEEEFTLSIKAQMPLGLVEEKKPSCTCIYV